MKRAAFTTAYVALLVSLLPGAGGAVPTSTAVPVISGTATEGSVLTVSTGTWTASGTPTYTYQWLRCGFAGSPCVVIVGATAATYTVAALDVGSTLRAAVTAKDSSGTNSATAAPTAAATGLTPAEAVTVADGKISIPPGSVIAPRRLVISAVEAPALVRAGTTFTIRVRVGDTRGYVVRGVDVSASPHPDNRAVPTKQVLTANDGWATLKVTPAATKRGSFLQLIVTASYSPPAAEDDEDDEDPDTGGTEGTESTEPLLSAEQVVRIPLAKALKRV